MLVVLLGTGASSGIPAPKCNCPTCSEARRLPVARRRNTAVLVVIDGQKAILVDAGFDVMPYVSELELKAVLITHWHQDHFAGLYRLRWIPGCEPKLPVYGPSPPEPEIADKPLGLELKDVRSFKAFEIAGVRITPLPLRHSIQTYGYLLEHDGDRVAFLFDTKGLPDETAAYLKRLDLKLAIIDSNFPPGHDVGDHNNVDEAIRIGKELDAHLTILTHIDHNNLPFTRLAKYVASKAKRMTVAYDGMAIHTACI